MRTLFFGMVLCFLALPAWAQEAAPEEATLTELPRLLTPIDVRLPDGTVFPDREVEVVLELEVNETGAVTASRVLQSAGEPFDQAAVAASGGFGFSPAKLSTGESVPVTITFKVRMPRPTPVAPPQAPPQPFALEGQLLERGTRKPLPDVVIEVKAGEQLLSTATSDAAGRFSLKTTRLPVQLFAVVPKHQTLDVSLDGVLGEERSEVFYLESQRSAFETTVRARAVRREVTKQVLPREEVLQVAGTQGDTLKAVQNLPGVARAQFGSGALILRGASPGDTRVFLEGQEIPILYHFGGLRSSFNAAFLEAVEFVPGNFSADYGRAMGGIIEVKVRDPASDLFRGNVDLNLYDAGFALEGPVGDRVALGFAFHRSYIDTLLPLFLPDDAPISFNTAPRYYDYQTLMTYRPDEDQRLRVFFYGSQDKVVLLFKRPASDPIVRGETQALLSFHVGQVNYTSKLLPNLSQESSLSVGGQTLSFELGPEIFFNLDTLRFGGRSAWTSQLTKWLELRAGIDISLQHASLELNSSFRPIEGENPPPPSTQAIFSSKNQVWLYEPALFVEARTTPHKDLSLIPSLRIDWIDQIREWSFDPRFTARFQLTPDTAFKGGVGFFHQAPTPDQGVERLGNPNLLPNRSSHSSLGVEHRLFEGLDLEFTGFYKWLEQQVIRDPRFFANPNLPPYLNGGTGRIYGLELLLKANLGADFSGWLAYTFQRSFRKDGPGADERPFDFDQPHILTAVANYSLGAGWGLGARFRLVSGNPATPVVDVIYDTGSDTWVPVYGQGNSERLPTFYQLDLRVDKEWVFERWKLALYLDVQNATNHKNAEGWSYNYDYSARQPVSGLPILPILGLKGEW